MSVLSRALVRSATYSQVKTGNSLWENLPLFCPQVDLSAESRHVSTVNTLFAFLVLLGPLVFIHELGHFLVAKATGVRVLVFSIGFGPRLFGLKFGDTDYRISLLPLGGYVKMFGDDIYAELSESEKRFAFLEKPFLAKSAIAAAGPVANFILPVVVLTFVFLGQEDIVTPYVGTLVPGGAAEQAGLQVGDTIASIDGQDVSSFQDIREIIEARPDVKTSIVVTRSGGTKATLDVTPRGVLTGDPIEPDKRVGRIGVLPAQVLPCVNTIPDSGAALSTLPDGARIATINGSSIDTAAALQTVLPSIASVPWSITAYPPTDDGGFSDEPQEFVIPVEDAQLVIEDDVRRFAVSRDELTGDVQRQIEAAQNFSTALVPLLASRRGLTPFEGVIADVQTQTSAFSLGLQKGDQILWVDGAPLTFSGEAASRLHENTDGIHVLVGRSGKSLFTGVFRLSSRTEWGLESMRYFGASLQSRFSDAQTTKRDVDPLDAVSRAATTTWMLIDKTYQSLKMLITGRVSPKSFGGPLTIANVGKNALESGWDRFIEVFCFISVNLGLINLLPIPVLDGGHLLIFSIEAIRRKKLKLSQKETALKIGFALLAGVMLLAIFNDVMRAFFA